MKRLCQIVLVSSLSLLFFSCYYDELPEEIDAATEIPEGQEISFATDIQPILAKCVACHNGTIANPDLREDNAYDALVPQYVTKGDGENSDLYKKLPGNDHPQDVGFILSEVEDALIKEWIDRGAELN